MGEKTMDKGLLKPCMRQYCIQLPFAIHEYESEYIGERTQLKIQFKVKTICAKPHPFPISFACFLMPFNKQLEFTEASIAMESIYDDFRDYLNIYIRAYRRATNNYYNDGEIREITTWRFGREIYITDYDVTGNIIEQRGHVHCYGPLYISIPIGLGQLESNQKDKIEICMNEILKKEFKEDIVTDLILLSKSHYCEERFTIAIITAISALDVFVSELIKLKGKEKGFTAAACKNLKKGIRLQLLLESVIPLLYNDESIPEEEVIRKCIKANELRNKILHDGKSEITQEEAFSAIENVEIFFMKMRYK